MMKHDKNEFRDKTFSHKSGCDFKLSQNQLVKPLMEHGIVDWKKGYSKSISAMDPLYYNIYKETYKWRTKLLTIRNGHGQSGWSPIGCKGLYFHAMCENGAPASGCRSPIKVLAQI